MAFVKPNLAAKVGKYAGKIGAWANAQLERRLTATPTANRPTDAAVYTYAPPTYAAPTATPITLTEVRRRVNFPVYVPSYIPVELTPEPVSLSRDSSVDWLVEL